MSVLELLFVYCAFLQEPAAVSQCMVDLHVCAYEALAEYPDRSFEDRVDTCAETIPFGEER